MILVLSNYQDHSQNRNIPVVDREDAEDRIYAITGVSDLAWNGNVAYFEANGQNWSARLTQ